MRCPPRFTPALLLLSAASAFAGNDPGAVARALVQREHPWQGLPTDIRSEPLAAGSPFRTCATPLVAFLPPGVRVGTQTPVGVRCTAGSGWTLTIPVSARPQAEVLVAGRSLAPGQPLQVGDVTLARRDIGALGYGYLTELPREGRWKLRQGVTAGQPLTPQDLAPDALLKRGQTVTLRYRSEAIAILQRGEALTDAALGERVSVRNRESGRLVDGVVRGDATVDVN